MASLDITSALKLVSRFFEREWAETAVEQVHIRRVTGGLMNTLHLLWRDSDAIKEPSAVLIRHFGLNGKFEEPRDNGSTLSGPQQAVVYWELSRRGWGPKIYGLFPGGRLEEYIDSHTLTAAESASEPIRRDIARSYARLHSLQLPLRKDGFKAVVQELSQGSRSKYKEVLESLLAIEDPRAKEYATIFQNTDWARELEWISELFKKSACKTTVTHGDANYLNILVKNFPSECKTVLIDYETVSYSYRGSDIGSHFTERMYCYNQPDSQLTGYDAPSAEEQRAFCEEYLRETQRLEVEGSENDTIDQLLLEAKIGRMYQLLIPNLMCTVYDEVEIEPLFLSGLTHMMKTYEQLKLEFTKAK